MPLDETEAWERMRTAILRYQADPSPENHAEMRRRSRAFKRLFCGNEADADGGKAAA
jgi:hypothetical protein